MDKYDTLENIKSKIEFTLLRIENKPENFKDAVKWIKEQLKGQVTKVEKIDKEAYLKLREELAILNDLKKLEQLDELKECFNHCIQYFSLPLVRNRMSLNLAKSSLSKSFFGQPSFLNVALSSKSYDEQKSKFYQDYISNIIEASFLNDFMIGEYTETELKNHIEQIQSIDYIGNYKKYYQNIQKKYIEKGKGKEEIVKYIQEKVFSSCTLCGSKHFTTSDYTEGNFIPLALSSENAINFFYQYQAKMPICDFCKLILFCIPAGVNTISKISREYKGSTTIYKEKSVFNFLNYDTDVKTLYYTNKNFSEKSEIYQRTDSPYQKLILDIILQKKEISIWELANIFIVEFDSSYDEKYCRMEYFHIPKYVALFFKFYGENTLSRIKNRNILLQVIDCILKNKPFQPIISDNTRNVILGENYHYIYDSFIITKIRLYLNLLKEGGEKVIIQENEKKLNVLYKIGTELHVELDRKGMGHKLTEYSYKMVNSIKAGNKKEFMDTILRLHMGLSKDVSPIFIEVMKNNSLDFESIGHSFLAGLISNPYQKKDQENEQGGEEK